MRHKDNCSMNRQICGDHNSDTYGGRTYDCQLSRGHDGNHKSRTYDGHVLEWLNWKEQPHCDWDYQPESAGPVPLGRNYRFDGALLREAADEWLSEHGGRSCLANPAISEDIAALLVEIRDTCGRIRALLGGGE